MTSLFRPGSLGVFLTLTALTVSSLGCGHKPSYLQKSRSTQVSERWKVLQIDPARLSPDEQEIFEKMGPPAYVRFFRNLSVEREKVYKWVYLDPVNLVTFIDGKKVDYAVLDEDPSSLNEAERRVLFWTGIVAGSAAAVAGGVYYYYERQRKD
jgi:hypothetical protein